MADDGLGSPTSTTADLLDYQSTDFSPSQIASVKHILENQKQALLEQSSAFRTQVEQALQRTQLLQHDIGTLSEFALRTSHAVALVEATEMNVQNTIRREESDLRERFEAEKAGLLRKIEEASHQSDLFRQDLQAMRQRAKEDREELFALQDLNRELTARITARETELSTKLKSMEDRKEQALRREAELESEICQLKEKLNARAKSRPFIPIDPRTDDPNRVIQALTEQYEELQQNYLELKEEYRCAQLEWWAREESEGEEGHKEHKTTTPGPANASHSVSSPCEVAKRDGNGGLPEHEDQVLRNNSREVEELQNALAEAKKLLTTSEDEKENLKDQVHTLMNSNAEMKQQLLEAETTNSSLREKNDELHTSLIECKEKLSSVESAISVLQNKFDLCEAEYNDLKCCLDKDFCHVIDELAASYNTVTAHGLHQSFVIPANIPAAEQVVRLKKTVLTLNARLNDECEKVKIMNKRLEDKQIEIKGLGAQMTKIESEWKAEYDMYLGTLHVEKQRRARLEETLRRLENDLEKSHKEASSQKAQISKLRGEVSATNAGMNKLSGELQEARKKLKEALSAPAIPPKVEDAPLDSGKSEVGAASLWDFRSAPGGSSALMTLVVLLIASLVILSRWIKIA